MTYLKSIGKYQLAERILLKTVLEEQELQMSDITSAETAVKVGEIFNLEGILVGSMMKVGELITINARIIDVQSGEIAASGIVEFDKLNQLKSKVEYLAYQLSGYSQSEYRRAVRDRELARNRLGARLGIGTNIAYNQQFRLVDLGVFFW